MSAAEDGWRRLDRRTVAVTAIVMAGVAIGAGVPTTVGIASNTSLGTALLWVVPAGLLLIAIGAGWDYLRWYKTWYRIGDERAELRTGILVRTRRSLHRDRIRAVDLTADPITRIFGLANVKIGTGESSAPGTSSFVLRPVTAATAEQLRRELLDRPVGDTATAEGMLAELDPAWVRYAPTSFLAPLLGIGAFGVVMNVSEWFGLQKGVIEWVADLFSGLPLVVTILVLIALALVLGSIGSLLLFVEMWWRFRLERESGGTLRVRRGLLTTRSISLEEKRLRGLEVVEPLGARMLGAARVDIIATGMVQRKDDDKTDHRTVLPPAPKDIADRVAADVLREEVAPTNSARLAGHPRAARGRRIRWALAAVVAVVLPLLVLGVLLTDVLLHLAWIAALVLLPIAILIALDSYRALGHGLTGDYLVARNGSVRRSTVALQRRGIIGWTARQSVFQRRAGLITLTATTAAGTGGYSVHDVGASEGLVFAEAAVPDLFAPFLEGPLPRRADETVSGEV
ncbi:hypothetical protein CFN78_04415 [Amycolatopsis antarctica]|uniref:YdbS-like PH domain-containing protein n=1 Tax=Amycolatopsis antarctica TaxID=1854586 RepID=A0A263D857_9PSEU|nr:PH domain-containing protein [Amycolatopsis antarctica]OZM74379.1 hypothetical protein CFN78_04415 [Amycolatopsis antarctica]